MCQATPSKLWHLESGKSEDICSMIWGVSYAKHLPQKVAPLVGKKGIRIFYIKKVFKKFNGAVVKMQVPKRKRGVQSQAWALTGFLHFPFF